MSRERNKTHKKNRIKKQMAFEDTKACFVAGVLVLMESLYKIIDIPLTIPVVVDYIMVVIGFLLFLLALGTSKMNAILSSVGVEKFGRFLTVYSIIFYLIEKICIRGVENNIFAVSLSNKGFETFMILLLFWIVGAGGAVFLLLNKKSKI